MDLEKDRVYIPLDVMDRHGYTVEELYARRFTPAFRGGDAGDRRSGTRVVRSRVCRWPDAVDRRLAIDLELFSRGGMRVLDKIEAQDYDVLGAPARRFRKWSGWACCSARSAPRGVLAGRGMTLEESYAYCQPRGAQRGRGTSTTRSVLLAEPQRRAMCAIYAFMRYCDDLSDDETRTDRAAAIARWQAGSRVGTGGPVSRASRVAGVPRCGGALRHSAPVLLRHDRRRQFRSASREQVQTFDELYRYCYQVASVVGLTIIHIFGFESPEALPLAEKCGIAFQLTNILRDVKEDAGNGRVYLPAEDLRRFGVSQRIAVARGRSTAFRELMRFEAARAESYYRGWIAAGAVGCAARAVPVCGR